MFKKIVLTLCCFIGSVGIVTAQSTSPDMQSSPQAPAAIDYAGFLGVSHEVQTYRIKRLVSKATFLSMASDPQTIILDTRSKAAFDMAHIDGAVHLNFSDFTQEKLAKIIADKDTRILIYCNNNFVDNVAPVVLKRVELALNIPTFINLYGYGYKNIYELADSVSLSDPDMKIVGIGTPL